MPPVIQHGREVAIVAINSLSSMSVDPLTPLTLNGTGFRPATAAISVLLTPQSGRMPISVPAFAATTNSIRILVPPMLGFSASEFLGGLVKVQVVQIDGQTLSTSNVVSGVTVNSLASVPAGLSTGAITRAFLTVGQNVSSFLQTSADSDPSLSALANDLVPMNTHLGTLISAIATFMQTGQSVNVATANGKTFTVDGPTLALSDSMIFAFLTQFASQVGSGSAQASLDSSAQILASGSSCPPATGDPKTDEFLCSVQQYHENLATTGAAAVQTGAEFEIGFYLGALGSFAVDGFVEAGALAEEAAKGAEMAWSAASSCIASYVTASHPPPLSDTLTEAVAEVVDQTLLGGLGILPTVVDTTGLCHELSELVPSSAGEAPEGGMILTDSQSSARPASTSVYDFQDTNGLVTGNQYAAPTTQQNTSTVSAVINVPPPSSFNGSYTGSLSGTYTDHFGNSGPISLTVAFTVTNGQMTVTKPFPGSGTLSSSGSNSGSANFTAADGSQSSFTFKGTFIINGSGGADAVGSFTEHDLSGGSSSGTWSAKDQ